jgi:hypothetical protein
MEAGALKHRFYGAFKCRRGGAARTYGWIMDNQNLGKINHERASAKGKMLRHRKTIAHHRRARIPPGGALFIMFIGYCRPE